MFPGPRLTFYVHSRVLRLRLEVEPCPWPCPGPWPWSDLTINNTTCVLPSLPHRDTTVKAGNINRREKVSTVDLLIKVPCLEKSK